MTQGLSYASYQTYARLADVQCSRILAPDSCIYWVCAYTPSQARAVLIVRASADSAEGASQIYSSLFWTCYKSERFVHHAKTILRLQYLIPTGKS